MPEEAHNVRPHTQRADEPRLLSETLLRPRPSSSKHLILSDELRQDVIHSKTQRRMKI